MCVLHKPLLKSRNPVYIHIRPFYNVHMQIKYMILLVFLFAAACTDVLTNKIKNTIIIAGLLTGGVLFFSKEAVTGLTVTFFILYPLYRIGWCGAGDVKLMMLTGFYLGTIELFNCTLTIVGLAIIFAELCSYSEKKPLLKAEIPFAVPVFLGVIPHMLFR